MGMRFRKTIKIAPGVKLNVGKKSAGISMGGKYGGISYNSKTGTKARTSIPGTGISFVEPLSSLAKQSIKKENKTELCATALDEKTIISLNDSAFLDYSTSYTAYSETLDKNAPPENIEECAKTLKLINSEYKRRNELKLEEEKLIHEPSLKLFVCGVICTICGIITIFFSAIGFIFILLGLIMLFAELRK